MSQHRFEIAPYLVARTRTIDNRGGRVAARTRVAWPVRYARSRRAEARRDYDYQYARIRDQCYAGAAGGVSIRRSCGLCPTQALNSFELAAQPFARS
jgi:hypothetical protein